ncbi:uncharacterized protein KY384_002545 [Bacidia gigantensis]|uniref:uncharacterized protein n=1 Tax=Bacidia gigantensis TaxID=2732470 RepID=UPI001D058B3F|nr:uncharacterized protein KY384_002545 [Bacidia gigantensis]KAG8532668.1 hypothetical protein KY384_002545 [Bacidia gigantensis]
MLLASAVISVFLGDIHDAISIFFAVLLVVTVGFYQEYQSNKAIDALSKLLPKYAHLIRGVSDYRRKHGRRSDSFSSEDQPKTPISPQFADTASETVPARLLVPGDLVIFSTGDQVPADVRLTEATDLTIDESNLTGENEPTQKQSDVVRPSNHNRQVNDDRPATPSDFTSPAAGTVGVDVSLTEQVNIAFQGTMVRSGHGRGIVVGTGKSTKFGAISASLRGIESPRTPLQQAMDVLGQQLTYMALIVITLIVLIGWLQGKAIFEMFKIGISLAVAAIPEGLPLTVSVTLALSVRRMSKRGATVKKIPHVETLGSVNVVCSDKTGTLTLNHMTVTKIWHFDAPSVIDVNKDFASSSPDQATRTVMRIGNVANNARLSRNHSSTPASASSAAIMSSTLGHDPDLVSAKSRWVGQPTDVALLDLMDTFGEDDIREHLGTRTAETTFSSERKWMGVIVSHNQGSDHGSGIDVPYIKGALEQILKRCDTYLSKDGREIILDEQRRKEAIDAAESMAQQGLRVLGFASGSSRDALKSNRAISRSGTPRPGATASTSKPADEETYNGLVFAGMVGMNDPPRKDVDKSMRRLMKGGVKAMMITGDAETTALAIARRIGMPLSTPRDGYRPVLRGDELDRMSEDELANAMAQTSIFARTSPEHKLKIVKALQKRGDIIAMTGDGVNDAPALKKADIGIAMGVLGTDVAKEAADMVLTDDNFSTILVAIEESKGIFYNIQNFLTFQLSTSLAALTLVFVSTALGYQTPLNPTQILWINVLMDGPPAQSLGREPVDPSVMHRPPRSKGDKVLTRRVLYRVMTSGIIIMLGTLLVYRYEMDADNTVSKHDTTMTFTCFVFSDMFNALTCRSESKSVLFGEVQLFRNRNFNYSVGLSLLGQMAIVYLPFFQAYADTEGLGFRDLALLLCIASTVFWVDEGRKFLKARDRRRRGLGGYSASV